MLNQFKSYGQCRAMVALVLILLGCKKQPDPSTTHPGLSLRTRRLQRYARDLDGTSRHSDDSAGF